MAGEMSDADATPDPTSRRRLEEPLHTRKRLSTPPQPVGDPPTPFANMALGLDAAFCNIVGLVFTLTGAFMADRLGIAGWILTVFGVVVLFWSFLVTLYANRRVARRREVERIAKVNTVAIVIAAVLIAIPDTMSRDGKVVFGALTLATLGFTIAQFMASRGLEHDPA